MPKLIRCVLLVLLTQSAFAGAGETLKFSGYDWIIRNEEGLSGPGPNRWDAHNVWLDEHGWLHLKIALRGNNWSCAEVYLPKNIGFGRYQWEIVGPLDQFDPHIVLGLFNYPRPDMGPDGTNEVDIEFARWGKASIHPGNFSVWPPAKTVKRKTHSFDFKLNGASSTSCFDWSSTGVKFQTRGGEGNIIEQWGYTPPEPSKYIPQQALPIHMNLWLCDGKTPEDKQEVEVIIKKFTFTPQASH